MQCPVCKAENQEPACRHCKADLSLLFQGQEEYAWRLAESKRCFQNKEYDKAMSHAQSAWELRHHSEAARCLSMGFLEKRDYFQALRYYMLAKK